MVRHVGSVYKDSSNLTHTVCFDVSIYCQIGEPDATNERMTHLLKLDTFFLTQDARFITHDAARIRATHLVDPALEIIKSRLTRNLQLAQSTVFIHFQYY